MKKSVTLIFPGQGSQYVGMGQGLPPDLFEQADQALDFPLSRLMFTGPAEKLALTTYTQPAILTHSVALFARLQAKLAEWGVSVDRVLGHSVGEYAALVAAEALDFQDAVRLVSLRGRFMQEAVPAGQGKMVAVMQVPASHIEAACVAASSNPDGEVVAPANYNGPSQVVISGHAQACDRAVAWLAEHTTTPHRCLELNVSAPFHSTLMKPAAEQLKVALDKVTSWKRPRWPYIANVDAATHSCETSPEAIRTNLYRQVDAPVLWTQSIQQLPDDTVCLEVGPGRILMGLARKINRHIKVIPLDREGAFQELEACYAR